ncbi:MAG: VOC family protein [Bacteroidetes bacterium]|nr:VOC family protein [Bacteroidota bacterium]
MDTNQPNLQQAVPFFSVSNMEASLPFYTDGLGFSIKNQWTPRGSIEWCWLQRDGVALMLQEPRRDHPAPAPEGKPGRGVSISFQCRDALALYNEFLSRGLTPTEPFVGNNMWVIAINDPDGYRLEFESQTEVAEETTYSEWIKSS